MDGRASPVPWRAPPQLHGRHASLEPLARGHVDDLRRAATDGRLWELQYTSVPGPAETEAYIEAALAAQAAGEALAFAVHDAGGDVVGSTRYYRLEPEVPRLAIGYTWYARRVQRTALNTQLKRLLLGHAFETMGCIAVAFETSAANHASRAAIARLGAHQDGILRNHMRHRDGSVRDTVCFSITDAEWPQVRSRLDAMLEAHGDG
jgi:N-acetyltransferase